MSHDPFQTLDETEIEPAEPEPVAAAEVVNEMTEESQQQPEESVGGGDGATLIALGDSLTIQEAAERFEVLKSALESDAPLVLDAAELTRLDGAGMQLLGLCFKEAGSRHLDLSWRSTTPELEEAARVLGLTDLLKLPQQEGTAA